jgi:hypothetical protein
VKNKGGCFVFGMLLFGVHILTGEHMTAQHTKKE